MITGKCLCGKVRYEINGRLGPVVYCHCSMCRRATGSAFATNASVRANNRGRSLMSYGQGLGGRSQDR